MLWICATDGVAYAPESPACPECRSTHYRPQGEEGGPVYVIAQEDEFAGSGPEVGDALVDEGAALPLQGDEVPLGTEVADDSEAAKPARGAKARP